jgi:lipooligosaccharide transport system permease protein
MIAAAAMTVASLECCWPVLYGFTRFRSFEVIASTPVRPASIVGGVAMFTWLRAAMPAAGVAVVLLLTGEARWGGLVLAVVFAALSALATGMPLAAFAATRLRQDSFPLIQRFVVLPMLLFGGVLFPVSGLPGWAAALVKVTPLWHGVVLTRAAALSSLSGRAVTEHLAYLAVWIAGGMAMSVWTFSKRLAR